MAIFDRNNFAEKKTQETLVSSSQNKEKMDVKTAEVVQTSNEDEKKTSMTPARAVVKDAIEIAPEAFGELYTYIEDDNIVNIDYNGRHLWVEETSGKRVNKGVLKEPSMIPSLCSRIKNGSRVKEFNKENPVLEAEAVTNGISLRFTSMHEDVAPTGLNFAIRKTPPVVRINIDEALKSRYITPRMLAFALNCVKARMSIVISGEPGAGKTELAKFLSTYIPDELRVATIEDNLEWHYEELKPNADCLSIRVNDTFGYDPAIRVCLRENLKWIMVAEVRGDEIVQYMSSLTSGVRGITTIHTDDVRKIPERMLNMSSDVSTKMRLENDIYDFVNVGIQISRRARDGEHEQRFVDQMAVFSREHGVNKKRLLFSNQKELGDTIPDGLREKFLEYGVSDCFSHKAVDDAVNRLKAAGVNISMENTKPSKTKESDEIKPFPGETSKKVVNK